METIEQTLYDFANAFGEATGTDAEYGKELFKELVGPITIREETPDNPANPAATVPVGNNSRIKLNPNGTWDEIPGQCPYCGGGSWSLAHEIGHAMTNRSGGKLSKQLEKVTGGSTQGGKYTSGGIPVNGPASRRGEDLAESVAAFVYPQEASDRSSDNPGYVHTDYTKLHRYSFIKSIVQNAAFRLD